MLKRNYVFTESGCEIAEKPEFEYFLGVLWTGFCGRCGRMLFTGGATKEQLKKSLRECRYCKTPVHIPDDLADRKERQY